VPPGWLRNQREGDTLVPPAPLPMPLQITFIAVAILLDLVGIVYCLNDLYQPDRRVAGANKDVWAIIIVIGSVIGWIVYFNYGRDKD
jgi:hypothetical protein